MIEYALTTAGWIAMLPRGECGHVLCVDRDQCVYEERP